MEREQTHPAVYWGGALCALGGAASALLLLQAGEGALTLALTGLGAGGTIAAMGGYLVVIGRANPAITRAARAFTQGNTDEALALTARVEAMVGRPFTRRSTELLRAMVSLSKGELDAAASHARASRGVGLGLLGREAKRTMAAQASGYLALALALRGDQAAVAEATAVEQGPSSLADSVARSILARAVLLDRQGKRGELAALLRAEGSLLLEASWPRERALGRALRRKLRGQPAGGYRQEAPGQKAPSGDAPEIEGWLRQVAPQVLDAEAEGPEAEEPQAGGANEAEAKATIEDEAPDAARQRSKPAEAAALPAVPTLRSRWPRRVAVAAALGALLVLIGVASEMGSAYAVIDGHDVHAAQRARVLAETISAAINLTVLWLPVTLLFVLMAVFVGLIRDQARLGRAMTSAQRLLWRGKPGEALAALAEPSAVRLPTVAAQAHLLSAKALEHLGQPGEALARCEQGIALASKPQSRMATHDVVAPELWAEKAFLLAALDREAEATAALEALERQFPAHAGKEQARFRVSLVSKLRRGKLGEAAALAAAKPASMSVGLREEMVCELLSILPRGPAAEGALGRLREEVVETPGVELWLDTYVPSALRALGRASRRKADAAHKQTAEITES